MITLIIMLCVQNKNDTTEFWNNYLGFIVVKPIPVTVIGYTVLKTYSNSVNFNDRNFWGLRDYKVHLFGSEITLKSLAFQEQDSVLSACATTAIWSMLNKASLDFHTILKSPSQITKDADKTSLDGSRLFPNKGLNVLQICQAIQNSGLVSEIKQPNQIIKNEPLFGDNNVFIVTNSYLKKILNAYSPIGIPIILIINVPNNGTYGLHAVTISGFKQTEPVHIAPKNEISLLSENIEKFYAHDDQWGPFARINFNGNFELITPWSEFNPTNNPTFITNIIVPVYPKIRISYEDIEYLVLGIDAILTLFFQGKIVSDLVWDIKINYSEDIKEKIKTSSLDDEYKISYLSKSQPKYIWLATCYIGDNKVFDFTFDATDVKSAMIGLNVICYLSDVKPMLIDFLNSNRSILEPLFIHSSKSIYYDFLIKYLKQ